MGSDLFILMLLESGDPNELPYEADEDDDEEEEFLCSLEKQKINVIRHRSLCMFIFLVF